MNSVPIRFIPRCLKEIMPAFLNSYGIRNKSNVTQLTELGNDAGKHFKINRRSDTTANVLNKYN